MPPSVRKRLTDEPPLLVLPSLACAFGLNEAVILQQVHYWLTLNSQRGRAHHRRDGRWWVHNTIAQWRSSCFPFWSEDTIWRTLSSLRKRGILLVSRSAGSSASCSYSIDYDQLSALLTACAAENRQDNRRLRIAVPAGCGSAHPQVADRPVRKLRIARPGTETNNRDYTGSNNNRDPAGAQLEGGEPPEVPVAASREPAVVASLISRLIELGVTETVAQDLVGAHSLESIERQLAALPYRGANDPAGTLVAAIRGGWAMPAALLQEAADRARAERHAEETRRREEERARRREDEKDEREALERMWEELPEEERAAINAECGARLARESPFVAARLRSGRGGTVVKAMLEGYRWEALREKVKGER